MTTSEQAREWAKAEAEKRWPFDITNPDRDHFYWARRAAAEWAFLHVLSLLESEQAAEAGATAIDEVPYEDFGVPAPSEVLARAALAAVVAAITRGGSENG